MNTSEHVLDWTVFMILNRVEYFEPPLTHRRLIHERQIFVDRPVPDAELERLLRRHPARITHVED